MKPGGTPLDYMNSADIKAIAKNLMQDISSIEDDNNKDKGEEEMDRLHWFEQNYEKYLTVDPPTRLMK